MIEPTQYQLNAVRKVLLPHKVVLSDEVLRAACLAFQTSDSEQQQIDERAERDAETSNIKLLELILTIINSGDSILISDLADAKKELEHLKILAYKNTCKALNDAHF